MIKKLIATLAICSMLLPAAMSSRKNGSLFNATPDNGWVELRGNKYYYEHGNPVTGWYQIGPQWYYFSNSGVMQTGWHVEGTRCYYLKDDGTMAAGEYIDRFYIESNGVWNSYFFNDSTWRVDGHWYQQSGDWHFACDDGTDQEIDLTTLRSINRLGYNTNSMDWAPQQSIAAYEDALEQGFNILLCDLQFTSDGVPVCFHDATINSKARNPDGTIIGEDLYVSEATYDELSQYDYGIYKGRTYEGTPLLKLEDMLSFCAENNVAELYIELKGGTPRQIRDAVIMANTYGVELSWAASTYTQAKAIVQTDPSARISLMPNTIDQKLIDKLLKLRTGENEVFVFGCANTILTQTEVNMLKSNNIPFEMGTVDSASDIVYYWNGCYTYCSGIESNTVVASSIDIGDVI